MNRRHFITSTAGAWAASRLAGNTANLYSANNKYRAAVIGHTGVGGYGHGWDTAFNPFDTIDVVAVADPDDTGRKEVMSHTGAKQGYRDYREMLPPPQGESGSGGDLSPRAGPSPGDGHGRCGVRRPYPDGENRSHAICWKRTPW